MHDPQHRASLQRRTPRAPFVSPVVALMLFASTASAAWKTPPVPERPNTLVEMPNTPAPESAAAPIIPEDLLKPGATITLAKVVDIALQNNPLTRASYLQARSAAADLGSKRAPYYPTVDVAVSGSRSNELSQTPAVTVTGDVYGPSVQVSYLLLDLGGRAANVGRCQVRPDRRGLDPQRDHPGT